MFTKITLTMVTIILLIALAGCGAGTSSNPNSSEGSSQADSSGESSATNQQMLPIISGKVASLSLDASADGSTQQLKKGEVMSVTLESNPSTGYSWFVTISDQNVIIQMAETENQEASPSTTPVLGAPEKKTFFFQAIEAGQAAITLDYQRGWETGIAPEQTINILVEVQ